MDATQEQKSATEKLLQKLADSRIFALSLLLHLGLVILAGSVYLFVAHESSDFVAEGGDGLLAPTDNLAPPPEAPPDAVPTEKFEASSPNVNSPNVDVISTTANANSFKVNANIKVSIQTNTVDLAKSTNNVSKGIAGGAAGLPGTMRGRTGSGRARAMEANKMKTVTEQAVIRGLNWLRDHQNPDGSWADKYKGGMTGFALLCFLGHGETGDSPNYGLTVSKAVQWILDMGTKFQGHLNMEETFDRGNEPVYEHGICTYALGEYYTMTKDERVIELLKQAVTHTIQGQGPGGGWAYKFTKAENDLSVSGWQIQCLKAAFLSQLNIPGVEGALDKAMTYLDSDRGPKGGYGYRGPEDRYSLSGVGVLCRLFWKGDRADVRKGMEFIIETTEKEKPVKYKGPNADLYAWYYHTQAALMFGGSAWDKWNRWFQDELTAAQNPDGSWPAPGMKNVGPLNEESMTGQVYRTTLCILMLEVYYRYMPSHSAI